MSEQIMMWELLVSSTLFMLGGYKWKALRRYLLPLAIGLPCLYYVEWWRIVAYILTLSIALHMGYGDRCSWFKRIIIFLAYTLPCLFIGWSAWIIIMPILFIIAFLLSNTRATASMFFWKGVEFSYGLGIAITLIDVINRGK